jgi:hypothetical protein
MKKYAVVLLLCALGCHSGRTTSQGFEARKGSINTLSIDPAIIIPDPTLGCQYGFSDPSSSDLTYANVIDGKAGSYKLKSALFYSESQSRLKKNTSSTLMNSVISVASDSITATQNVTCSDLHEIDNASESNVEQIPLQINRVDGTIQNDVSFSSYLVKGKRNPTNRLFPPKITKMAASFPDLKGFIQTSVPRRFREVEMTMGQDQELHILITDRIVNLTGSTAIHKILAIYVNSGT